MIKKAITSIILFISGSWNQNIIELSRQNDQPVISINTGTAANKAVFKTYTKVMKYENKSLVWTSRQCSSPKLISLKEGKGVIPIKPSIGLNEYRVFFEGAEGEPRTDFSNFDQSSFDPAFKSQFGDLRLFIEKFENEKSAADKISQFWTTSTNCDYLFFATSTYLRSSLINKIDSRADTVETKNKTDFLTSDVDIELAREILSHEASIYLLCRLKSILRIAKIESELAEFSDEFSDIYQSLCSHSTISAILEQINNQIKEQIFNPKEIESSIESLINKLNHV